MQSENECLLLNLNWAGSGDFGILYPTVVALPLEFAYILSDLTNRNHNVSFVDSFVLKRELEEMRTEIERSRFIAVCSSGIKMMTA